MKKFTFPQKYRNLIPLFFDYPHSLNSPGDKKIQGDLLHQLKSNEQKITIDSFTYPNLLPFYNRFIFWMKFTLWVLIFFYSIILYKLPAYTIISFGVWINLFIIGHILIKNIQRKREKESSQLDNNFKESKEQKFSTRFNQNTKNLELHIESTQNIEFEAKLGILIFLIPYNSQKIPIENEIHQKITNIIKKTCALFLLLAFITNVCKISNLIYEESAVYQIFNILGIFALICWIFTHFVEIAITNRAKVDSYIENSLKLTAILHLITEIRQIKPTLKWLDLSFVFTGENDAEFNGTIAYLNQHVKDLKNYKDTYVIRVNSLASPTIKLSKIAPRNKKMGDSNNSIPNFEIRDLISHLCLTQSINASLTTSNLSFMTYWRYSKIFRNKLTEVVFFDEFPKIKNVPQTKHYSNNDNVCENIIKTSELFYNLILTLDKRINDKIESGE